MKRLLFSILLSSLTFGAFCQEDITLFFLNNGTFKGFYDEEIDSIVYSHLDLDSIWHNDAVVQEIWTADSVVRIPIEDIDSICHKIPDPVYKPGVILLDERYLPYITSVDGMSITFSSDLPADLRPHQGDALVYEGTNDLFPEGFAGKVVSEGNRVTCEEAEIPDIYEKIVFFGSYIMVNKNESAAPAYALRRVKGRNIRKTSLWDDEYGIDNWRMGDGTISDIGIGTIKTGIKIDMKKIHTSLNFDFKVTPVISIEYAYDMYARNLMLFYKRTLKVNYDNKYLAKYSRDMKPDDNSQKTFWNNFWKGVEPDWHDTTYGYMDDENDDEDTQSLFLINEEAPIPECPLLKIGVQLGLFCQPKLEGELSIGVETKGCIEKTFVYSSRYGRTEAETKKCEKEFVFEGSVKGSLWAGLVAGLHVNLGLGKGNKIEGLTEEVKLRVGPYLEGEIKANFADAIADRSWYQLWKDSKVKTGVKVGLDANFTAKLGGVIDFKWNQFSWSPKNLIEEHDYYLYPEFEAPTYTTSGNRLICMSKVKRATFPNKIGFILLDENGVEQVRKYQNDSYKWNYYSDDYTMSETFDNLDFVNHRYTIVPTTRLFGWQVFGLDMPDNLRTTVLCPNSNHPHLIDLGLPSGTKWLCQNVYAKDPQEVGGYYQWGKSYMVNQYNEASYHAPNISANNYQGTECDAATANMGNDFVTPTSQQFSELLSNCSPSYQKSTWGNTVFGFTNGVFLKGRNGNNLYLPFAGYKSGTTVDSESRGKGFYLTSDAAGNSSKKAYFISESGNQLFNAQWKGYSVRPVSFTDAPVQNLSLSSNAVSMTLGGTSTVQIISGSGNYSVVSDKPSVATADLSGSTITITPKAAGTATITVTDTQSGQTASIVVTVIGGDNPTTDAVAVDLGLPSGTKWADRNVGASKPEDYGGYYAWGETEEKEVYTWSTYIHCDGTKETCHDIGQDIAGTQYDVAHVKWGGSWTMPTLGQLEELWHNCTSEWTTVNGINGRRFTGPNGNSVFIPAAGYRDDSDLRRIGEEGLYWSSTLEDEDNWSASGKCFDATDLCGYGTYREQATPIRPVISGTGYNPTQSCPDSNHPHMIDLGIGVKWACCNVGAHSPEEYGGEYAWGETEEKEVYDWSTYIHCDGTKETCHDIGEEIAGTDYDVAHIKWGGDWMMPSAEQMRNLAKKCTSEWTYVHGIRGRKFTGPNGNTIFLPGGNYWSGTSWSGSISTEMYIGYTPSGTLGRGRDCGFFVRPVSE